MKKFRLLVVMMLLVMSLSGCAGKKFNGSGTEEDPWLIGQGDESSVTAFILNGGLWVNGTGRMVDFDRLKDRPWNKEIADLTQVSVFDDMEYIGKNAFKGAGKNTEFYDIYLSEGIQEIGESAFADNNFLEDATLFIPEGIKKIGAKAFENARLGKIFYDGQPDEIAADAFKNVVTDALVRDDLNWNEDSKKDYGGTLTYLNLYKVEYTEDYGTDDMTMSGYMLIAENDMFYYNAEDSLVSDDYHFDHYELVSGEYYFIDPTDPEINSLLLGDISFVAYYLPNE